MIFNSYVFIFIFLPTTWLMFHYGRTKLGIGFAFKALSVSSLIYYAWWNPLFVFLPLASAIFNFLWGKRISRSEKPKRWVIPGIILNLLLLAYFKYAIFFIENLNLIVASPYEFPKIILPDRDFLFHLSADHLLGRSREGKMILIIHFPTTCFSSLSFHN